MKYTMSMLVLLATVAGCSPDYKSKPMHADFFPQEDEIPLTTRALQAQSARGARQDAMLHPAHFDGPTLNSLGRDKLKRMLADPESPLPLTVYLNTSNWSDHSAATSQHLSDLGLTPNQFKLIQGPNPGTHHPAAPAISALSQPAPAAGDAPAAVPATK